jgi:hypothetical protein
MWTVHKSGLAALALLSTSFASDILFASGFSSCLNDGSVVLNNLNLQFDRSTHNLTYNVSGWSAKQHKVKASLVVVAYGTQALNQTLDLCATATKVDQLCPGMLLSASDIFSAD